MYEIVSRGRVQIGNDLTVNEIDELARDPELVYLQFSEPLQILLLEALNERLFAHRKDVWLRVFGHYAAPADLSFLACMPDVSKVSLDCLTEVTNLEKIASLSKLEALILDVYLLDSLDVLYAVPDSLEELHIGKTKSKKPDLYAIQRFGRLNKLKLHGQAKNIESIRYLSNLESLTLGSGTVEDAEYLTGLPRLRKLEIANFGVREISGLANLSRLESLKLWNAKLPGELSFLSGLSALRELSLDAMSKVTELSALSALSDLRSVRLENLKRLERLDELEQAPALEEFAHFHVGKMEPEAYLPILRNPNVRRVSIGFQSAKKYEAFEKLACTYGKTVRSWYN